MLPVRPQPPLRSSRNSRNQHRNLRQYRRRARAKRRSAQGIRRSARDAERNQSGPSSSSLISSSAVSITASGSASSPCSVFSGNTSNTASSKSPIPLPCSAEIGITFLKPNRRKFSAPAFIESVSILFTARNTGFPPRSNNRANSISGEASSVRPSTTITMASASSSPTFACLKISLGISASSSGTTPASYRRSAHRAPSIQSRHRCGPRRSPAHPPTIDRRDPVSQLNSVLFPTFGRPQTAISGRSRASTLSVAVAICAASSSTSRQSSNSSIRSRPATFADRGVCRPTIPSAGRASPVLSPGNPARLTGFFAPAAAAPSPRMVFRFSLSGDFFDTRAALSTAARFVERIFLFRGSTAPVVGVLFGARPFFGRVLACRCFSTSTLPVISLRHNRAFSRHRSA